MTENQLKYLKYQEDVRHNAAVEQETARSNLANEQEMNRSNVAREAETHRSNMARELQTEYQFDETMAFNRNKLSTDTTVKLIDTAAGLVKPFKIS